MYLADAFNALALFQRLGGWLPHMSTAAEQRAQVLLQRGYQSLTHVVQGETMRDTALHQFALRFTQLEGSPHRVHAWSPVVAALLVELSAGLASLRVLQNETWALATVALGVSDAPSSLHEAPSAPA